MTNVPSRPLPFDPSRPDQGVQFECTRCGACCRWDGLVYLYPADVLRLARFRGLDVQSFVDTYCRHIEVVFTVRDPETGDRVEKVPYLVLRKIAGGSCAFLGDKNQCGVHDVKPWQCASMPFSAEVLLNREALRRFGEMSPGFGHGAYVNPDEIRAHLAVQRELDDEYERLLTAAGGSLAVLLGVDLPAAEAVPGHVVELDPGGSATKPMGAGKRRRRNRGHGPRGGSARPAVG